MFCFKCKKIGHSDGNCRAGKGISGKVVQKVGHQDGNEGASRSMLEPDGNHEDEQRRETEQQEHNQEVAADQEIDAAENRKRLKGKGIMYDSAVHDAGKKEKGTEQPREANSSRVKPPEQERTNAEKQGKTEGTATAVKLQQSRRAAAIQKSNEAAADQDRRNEQGMDGQVSSIQPGCELGEATKFVQVEKAKKKHKGKKKDREQGLNATCAGDGGGSSGKFC